MLSIKTSLCSALLLATQAVAVAQWSGTQGAGNMTVEYCSKENTGVKNDQGSDIYNTLGLCNDKCVGKYAYAVLQYQECWCSNEKPSDTVNLESCDQKCPGYPDQNCGSKDAGLFGYVPLEGGDSASSAAPTSASPSSASNATAPTSSPSFSAASNSSSTTENGNSSSTSDAATETYTGDSASLSVSRTALAMSAIVIGCAFGFTA